MAKNKKYKVRRGDPVTDQLKVFEHEFPFKEMTKPGDVFELESDNSKDYYRLMNRYREYRKYIDPEFRIRVNRIPGAWRVKRK